jgi:hypothetical protein
MTFMQKYFSFLGDHPERIDGLLMWFISTSFLWFWIIRKREIAIKGMQGSNLFWEGHEQVIYWAIMAIWPIVFKAAFISDNPVAVWYIMGGLIGFALLGRSILDYGLAFLGRAPVKKEPDPQPTTTTTTTTKTE